MVTYIKKARKVGGSLVVTIPLDVVSVLDVHEQEYLEISIEKVNRQ